jgi:CysZ protein
VRDLLRGALLLARGFRYFLSRPRVMLWGILPAFIVGVFYLAAIVLIALNLDGLVTLTTPWARGWQLEPLVRIGVGIAMVMIVVVVLVYTFVAVTLALGDPFYERVWRAVEEDAGTPPEPSDEPFLPALLRSAVTAARLLLAGTAVAIGVAVLGVIPVVGQIVAPLLGAGFAAWFLALELCGRAFDARGLSLRDRRRLLGARRARTLGFGLACYLLFLIPFAAIVVMPAAVAGAAMLAREALSDSPESTGTFPPRSSTG